MNIVTNLFLIILTLFILNYLKLIFIKSARNKVNASNNKLNELRTVEVKTIEQQKEFLNTKFPKGEPFKFTWMWLLIWLIKLVTCVIAIFTLRNVWLFIFGEEVNMALWVLILFIIIFPIISNQVLKLFNLQGDDLLNYIK